MSSTAPVARRLSFITKLSYGLGAVAFGVGGQALSTAVITQYLFIVMGVPALLVGTAIMVSQVVDALADPLLGRWSDTTRTRWGRRHPFMYAAAIPCSLAFYALWSPPTAWPAGALFIYMLLTLLVVRFFTAMYEIPSTALAPELAPDYHDRTILIAYRWLLGSAGAGVMIALLNLVFLRHDANHPLGILNRAGYSQWGSIAAVAILVSMLGSSLATHRLIPTLSLPPVRKIGAVAAIREVLATLTNRSLTVLMLSGLISGVGGGITTVMGPYLYLYFWGLPPQYLAGLVLVLVPATLAGTVLAPVASRRFGKKPTMIAVFAVSLVVSLIPISLRLIDLMPANGSPWLIPILFVDAFVSGLLSLMGSIIITSMVADVVEEDAVRSGERSEGLLFAANGLIPKISGGVGAFVGGLIITIVHFPAHAQQGSVAPALLHKLGLIYLPIAAVMSGLAIAVLQFYRIDQAAHERHLATLAGE